jgi:hypothetical protein
MRLDLQAPAASVPVPVPARLIGSRSQAGRLLPDWRHAFQALALAPSYIRTYDAQLDTINDKHMRLRHVLPHHACKWLADR